MTSEIRNIPSPEVREEMDLVSFLAHWERTLDRMMRKHPVRWSVKGWSPEEVRDALTLRLIERAAEQAGGGDDAWAFDVLRDRLAELRKTHRIDARVAEIPDAPLRLPPRPTQEDAWLEAEATERLASARARAESSLSQPQRRWYAAMQMAANAGDFFAASDDLNLSAAARLLRKHRSSAVRAYDELQTTFRRELPPDDD